MSIAPNPNGPETKVPSIPTAQTQEEVVRALRAIKELVEVREGVRGNPIDANVTWRELVNSGIANIVINGQTLSGGGNSTLPYLPPAGSEDLTAPPAPVGLTATGSLSNIILTWNAHSFPLVSMTEIWRSSTDVAPNVAGSLAIQVGTTETELIFADAVGAASQTFYYWIRYRTKWDVPGPYSASAASASSPDPAKLMELLAQTYGAAEVYQKPFYYVGTQQTINGATIPVGTYIKSAYIMDAAITNAKIANLAVDNAKIVDLAVSKLNAGSLKVGAYIESTLYTSATAGWQIKADGNAEFNNVTARGTIVGTAGSIGGILMSGSAVYSGQTAFNTGTGFFLGANGKFSVGNGSTNRVSFDGTTLTIRGGLNADDISSGTISTDRLSAGARGTTNLLKNSDWTERSTRFSDSNDSGALMQWVVGITGTANSKHSFGRNYDSGRVWNVGLGGMYLYDESATTTNTVYVYQQVPVTADTAYEWSVYTSTHRCTAYMYIEWIDSLGAIIGYSGGTADANSTSAATATGASSVIGGATGPASMQRWWASGAAPANSVAARLFFVKSKTISGAANSFLFLHRPMFCAAPAGAALTNQTPWEDGGITIIDGGAIATKSITAASAVLADASVGTLQIGVNSVTVPAVTVYSSAFAYTAGQMTSLPQSIDLEIATVTLTVSIATPAILMFTAPTLTPVLTNLSATNGSTGQSLTASFILRINGALSKTYSTQTAVGSNFQPMNLENFVDQISLPSGTCTVSLRLVASHAFQWDFSATLSFAAGRSMIVLGCQR